MTLNISQRNLDLAKPAYDHVIPPNMSLGYLQSIINGLDPDYGANIFIKVPNDFTGGTLIVDSKRNVVITTEKNPSDNDTPSKGVVFDKIEIRGDTQIAKKTRLKGLYIKELYLNALNAIVSSTILEDCDLRFGGVSGCYHGLEAAGTYYINNITLLRCSLIDYSSFVAAASKGAIYWTNTAEGCGQLKLIDCSYAAYDNGAPHDAILLKNKGQLDSMEIRGMNPVIPADTLTGGFTFIDQIAEAKLMSCLIENCLFEFKCAGIMVNQAVGVGGGLGRLQVMFRHNEFSGAAAMGTQLITNAAINADWASWVRNQVAFEHNSVRGNVGTITIGTPAEVTSFKFISKDWLGNFKTDNKGTSTGTGAQQTIPHGCNFTPTFDQVFLCEAQTGGALAKQTAVPNATNIYITATNLKDYNWRVSRDA